MLRLKEGNEAAFQELYNRYAPTVRAVAYSKLNSVEAAKEIVQEIFMDLWERRSHLNIESLPKYLTVAVKYQVINHFKKQITIKKHAHYYKTFERIVGEETLQEVEFESLQEALEKGMSRLPPKTQTIFKLSRVEHKSIAEIADELNLSQQAIKYHITQSLKELRLHLKDFIVSVGILVALLYTWP